jgi:hypothetical protein
VPPVGLALHFCSLPLPAAQVKIPKQLDSKERELVETLKEMQAAKPAGESRGD